MQLNGKKLSLPVHFKETVKNNFIKKYLIEKTKKKPLYINSFSRLIKRNNNKKKLICRKGIGFFIYCVNKAFLMFNLYETITNENINSGKKKKQTNIEKYWKNKTQAHKSFQKLFVLFYRSFSFVKFSKYKK